MSSYEETIVTNNGMDSIEKSDCKLDEKFAF
jgi:hypothetical protein